MMAAGVSGALVQRLLRLASRPSPASARPRRREAGRRWGPACRASAKIAPASMCGRSPGRAGRARAHGRRRRRLARWRGAAAPLAGSGRGGSSSRAGGSPGRAPPSQRPRRPPGDRPGRLPRPSSSQARGCRAGPASPRRGPAGQQHVAGCRARRVAPSCAWSCPARPWRAGEAFSAASAAPAPGDAAPSTLWGPAASRPSAARSPPRQHPPPVRRRAVASSSVAWRDAARWEAPLARVSASAKRPSRRTARPGQQGNRRQDLRHVILNRYPGSHPPHAANHGFAGGHACRAHWPGGAPGGQAASGVGGRTGGRMAASPAATPSTADRRPAVAAGRRRVGRPRRHGGGSFAARRRRLRGSAARTCALPWRRSRLRTARRTAAAGTCAPATPRCGGRRRPRADMPEAARAGRPVMGAAMDVTGMDVLFPPFPVPARRSSRIGHAEPRAPALATARTSSGWRLPAIPRPSTRRTMCNPGGPRCAGRNLPVRARNVQELMDQLTIDLSSY